jgi:serine/threonine protein kinase
MRETKEKESWRTRWYEPPDLQADLHNLHQGKISRLFDIWSMGCVIFETMLWILYGSDSITQFLRANGLEPEEKSATPYWRKIHGKYEVTKTAKQWMNHIINNDPEGKCAIGDVVKLVRDRLLRIDLPPDSDKFSEGYRTNASDLKDQLGEIIRMAERDEYLFSGRDRSKYLEPPQSEAPRATESLHAGSGSLLSPKDAERRKLPMVRGQATTIQMQREYTNKIQDKWRISDDQDIIETVVEFEDAEDPDLCEICENIDLSASELNFTFATLQSNLGACDMCDLVYKVTKDLENELGREIVLVRFSDTLVIRDTERKVLRLCHAEKSEYIYPSRPNIP